MQGQYYIKVIRILVLSGIILPVLITCEKPERMINFASLEVKAEDITYSSVILKGEITDLGSKAIEQHGFVLSESSFPELGQQNSIEKPLGPAILKGIFQAQFTGLKSNTTYYFRSFVIIESVPRLSIIRQFTTKDATPVVNTGNASRINSVSAILNGTVNAKELTTTVTFEYGLSTSYGSLIDDNQIGGSNEVQVSAYIDNLTDATTYHFRIKAVNDAGTAYGDDISFTTPERLTDADGNEYNVVIIGAQMWMQENLRTTRFNDDSDIPLVTGNYEWTLLSSPAYCYYNNDENNYRDRYGALYNWHAVNTGILCPQGWHVVSDGGWSDLTAYLGGENIAGGKLKEDGTELWEPPNSEATNETDFRAVPGGFRNETTGAFSEIGQNSYYWTSTENSTDDSWLRSLHYNDGNVSRTYGSKRQGYSVRCVKGELPAAETHDATLVSSTSVTLNGMTNPYGTITEITFEYGTTTSYGSEISSAQSPVSSSESVDVNAVLAPLTPGTTYHFRLRAENSAGIVYGEDKYFTTPEQVTDTDGNVYETIIIGNQVWMKENLITTKLNDGTDIPNVVTNTAWQELSTPGYCWYDNDQENYSLFGLLYNWYAVNTGKLCPLSWHVPTDAEWAILVDCGTIEETGFPVQFGGRRNNYGVFEEIHYIGNWWSSTEFTTQNAFSQRIVNPSISLERGLWSKAYGFSIRCIKD